jgi:hypothetical protein
MSSLDGSTIYGTNVNYSDQESNSTRKLRSAREERKLLNQIDGCFDLKDCDAINKAFEWQVTKYDSRELIIETQFEKPGSISTLSYGQDNLEVSILEPTFFEADIKDHRNFYKPNTLDLESTK